MWFNRKSTGYAQRLDRLESRLSDCQDKLDEECSLNRRNLLEYAELGEKMRRLYLRIARRAKIEQEETSAPESHPENSNEELDPRKIRERIEHGFWEVR